MTRPAIDLVRTIRRRGPDRVVADASGEATSPARAKERGIEPDVILLRDDGWSLGAPRGLELIAYSIWKERWTVVFTARGKLRFNRDVNAGSVIAVANGIARGRQPEKDARRRPRRGAEALRPGIWGGHLEIGLGFFGDPGRSRALFRVSAPPEPGVGAAGSSSGPGRERGGRGLT